jgi:hypothetical protein
LFKPVAQIAATSMFNLRDSRESEPKPATLCEEIQPTTWKEDPKRRIVERNQMVDGCLPVQDY